MKLQSALLIGVTALLAACTTNNYYYCDRAPGDHPPHVRDGDVPPPPPHHHVPPKPVDAQ